MHLKRWITGIIAIPILVYLIGPGPPLLFHVILCITSIIGLIEFHKMIGSDTVTFTNWINFLLTVLLFISFSFRQIHYAPGIIFLYAFHPMVYQMFRYKSSREIKKTHIISALLGPVYIALPLGMLILIDIMVPKGSMWIFFLLAVIFSTDTGAFYFGRFFGKHKLYKEVSPKKTWEGAIGGLLSGIVVAMIFVVMTNVHEPEISILILIILLSVVSQIGDLVESTFKRSYGIKDSGSILPGHGGILDRIDGLLFAIPVLYIYLVWAIM